MKLALCFFLLLPHLAIASVFKCTDERGRVTYSTSSCGDNAKFIYYAPLPDSLPSKQVHQSSEQVSIPALIIPDKNGYRVSGSVKGVPVRFHVDTGATITSISRKVADQAGIYECRSTKYQTANGTMIACDAIASEITFGNFLIRNIEVSISAAPDGAASDALLGMNALRHFKIEQQGGFLKISR